MIRKVRIESNIYISRLGSINTWRHRDHDHRIVLRSPEPYKYVNTSSNWQCLTVDRHIVRSSRSPKKITLHRSFDKIKNCVVVLLLNKEAHKLFVKVKNFIVFIQNDAFLLLLFLFLRSKNKTHVAKISLVLIFNFTET